MTIKKLIPCRHTADDSIQVSIMDMMKANKQPILGDADQGFTIVKDDVKGYGDYTHLLRSTTTGETFLAEYE